MVLSPVPESVLELVQCKCKKGCKTNSCSCRKSKLVCCDACFCKIDDECENIDLFVYESENDCDTDAEI